MLWSIIFVLLFLIFGVKQLYEFSRGDGFIGFLFSALSFIVLTTGVIAAGLSLAFFIGLAVPKDWTGPESVELVTLRNHTGITGSSYLGTGSIGSNEYYFFYKRSGAGYQPGKVNTNAEVTVFETQNPNGLLKIWKQEFVSPRYKWIAIQFPEKKKYEFYIPEGTITRNFVLE